MRPRLWHWLPYEAFPSVCISCRAGGRRAAAKTAAKPRGYWTSKENCRAFLDQVAKDFDVQEVQDWSRVRQRDILERGGRGLLHHFSSVSHALSSLYPEKKWVDVSHRPKKPSEYWQSEDNCRSFLEEVAREYEVRSPDDWVLVTNKQIVSMGGGGLLQRYKTIHAALGALFPEIRHRHAGALRPKVPNGYWEKRENRRRFLDEVAASLGVATKEDWAAVRQTDVVAAGGGGLLARFPSFFAALRDAYEGEDWEEYECRRYMHEGYWEEEENVRRFLVDRAADRLGIVEPKEWARVSKAQLCAVGGGGLLAKMSLPSALAVAYPKEAWGDHFAEGKVKKAEQRSLKVALNDLFVAVKELDVERPV